jgi:hypothetical protein
MNMATPIIKFTFNRLEDYNTAVGTITRQVGNQNSFSLAGICRNGWDSTCALNFEIFIYDDCQKIAQIVQICTFSNGEMKHL